jgi:hypothetical protein
MAFPPALVPELSTGFAETCRSVGRILRGHNLVVKAQAPSVPVWPQDLTSTLRVTGEIWAETRHFAEIVDFKGNKS